MLTVLDTPLPPFLQNPWSWVIIAGFVFLLMALARGQVNIFGLRVELQPGMRVASGVVSAVLMVIGILGLAGLIIPPPKTPESLYRSGKQALDSGDRATALKRFNSSRRMLAIHPCEEVQIEEWWSDLYFQLSSLETSDMSAAKIDVLSSLCLNPDNKEAQRTLRYLDNGNSDAAAADAFDLGEKLTVDPDRANKLYILVTEMSQEPEAYLKVGTKFSNARQFDQASQLFKKGDDASKGNAGYTWTRGEINKEWGNMLFNMGQCSDAKAKLQEAAGLLDSIHKNDPYVRDLLNRAEAKQGC